MVVALTSSLQVRKSLFPVFLAALIAACTPARDIAVPAESVGQPVTLSVIGTLRLAVLGLILLFVRPLDTAFFNFDQVIAKARFDRTDNGDKLHMQSLTAMMHYDFNQPDAYSYEQALQVIRRIGIPTADVEQQFLRAVFNVLARNHDDHVKNVAYLMNRAGEWRLSPAFDVVYSYNRTGAWTSRHQMSINGKRDDFVMSDFLALAEAGGIKAKKAKANIDRVTKSVGKWVRFAEETGVDRETIDRIWRTHRTLRQQ